MAGIVFNPLGGIPQMQIQSADDLARIGEVDRARWAATSAPISQFFCDPAFLACIDEDKNGRVRVDEVLAAQSWLWARLATRDGVSQRSDTLQLAHLDPEHPEARTMRALADRLLTKLGATDRGAITLAQLRGFRDAFTQTFPNGDGVVAPSQIADPEVKALAEEIVAATGGGPDLGGEAGVRAADLVAWRDRCAALRAWRAKGAAEDATLRPLGDATAAGAALVQALQPKITQFFAQCALLAADPAAAARLTTTAEELAALDVRDAGAIDAWLDRAPVARPNADGVLDLTAPTNPRFHAQLRQLADDVGPGVLGRDAALSQLDAATWSAVVAAFQPWLGWQAETPTGVALDTPDARLAVALDSGVPASLQALIDEDQRVADELQEFHDLEKLILYQRWLLELANNFVSFQQLFDPNERSLFEMGTLVLDGRRLSLCTKIEDVAVHKSIAEHSGMFITYVDLTRTVGGANQTAHLAAAVTSGTRGGIDKGRRGVFYDRDHGEWDAIITDVIVQPISVWEAMISPVERIRRLIADRIKSFTESKAAALEADATTKAKDAPLPVPPAGAPAPAPAAPAAPAAAPAAAPPAGGAASSMQALLVGGSVAFAAIGSALAFVVQTLSSINPLGLITGVGAVIATLMAASGVVGWIRLMGRDLSALLEANGWALNGRMRMTFRLGESFTVQPKLPQGHTLRWTPEQKRTAVTLTALVILLLGIGYWFWTHPELLQRLIPTPPPLTVEAPPAAPAAPPP